MKNAFLLLVAIGLALLGAALAPVFLNDPGMVHIRVWGWTVEMSVLVLVLAVLVTWMVFWLAARLWRMPAESARRLREQRGLKQLEKGLLALTEGDWVAAERALQKSASQEGRTTARYLAAAQAADGQDAEERAEYYLEQADSGGRKTRFLVELTRARLMVENGRYDEAVTVLEALQARRKRHSQVLELLARCYRELGRWQDLVKLLPLMEKSGLLDEERATAMRERAASASLEQAGDLETLQSAWQALPRAMRKQPVPVRAYAVRASRLGSPDLTESVLRTALGQQWDPALVLAYGDPAATDTNKRMKQCEKWLKDHPDDSALHLALGRLCARDELWGKARHHMIRSLELEPTIGGYDSLGQLLERKGELEVAMTCFRNALRVSQGESPLPLPAETARLNAPQPEGSTASAGSE
ncbi:heme biosynthesis HemY N-terminal domain-containing protein [Elongatibacter sediminis]|uniref:Heme biosynthesis HemY N-terminal domain-containing protein n=1 Tax=Elongatibacter sediminis TaxID=3119006 RepID=A0AAW9REB4_9GAMM